MPFYELCVSQVVVQVAGVHNLKNQEMSETSIFTCVVLRWPLIEAPIPRDM